MKVFVTRAIPETGLTLLKQKYTVTVYPHDRLPTKQEIMTGVKDADGLLCLLTDPIDTDVITSAPHLKMISTYAVGYDNIDIATASARGILISNTPGVLTDATAELAWALLMSAARRIPEGDQYCRQGHFKGWAPLLMLGQSLTGKTLGIIGAGRIGAAMAHKSRGFDMNILYTDTNPNPSLEQDLHAQRVPLNDLLHQADFISIHVALSKTTRHLISTPQFKLMKPTAVLINTSRGPVVDEAALATALKNHQIFSAGLDVYEHEPAISQALLKVPNIVLAPHLGSATFETRSDMARMAAENMIAGLSGQLPPNCVNPDVFKKKKLVKG